MADNFDDFRSAHGPARAPRGPNLGDVTTLMNYSDGLEQLNNSKTETPIGATSLPGSWLHIPKRLWVVRETDVVHALEKCPFGDALSKKCVKHTNLTGGAKAFGGGEIVFVTRSQVVVNGFSGRYPVRSPDGIQCAAMSFKNSGYDVWSMGWDADAACAARFGTLSPTRIG